MKVLKAIWIFIRNFFIFPLVFSIIVGIVVGFLTQDSNQGEAAREAAEMNRLQPTAKSYERHTAELQEPDFDAVSISIMVSFVAAVGFMIVVTILDSRDAKKKAAIANNQ